MKHLANHMTRLPQSGRRVYLRAMNWPLSSRATGLSRPLLAALLLSGCEVITGNRLEMRPQTVTLLATPKFVGDFDSPSADARRFLEHYMSLISPANETILIFAVGNSQHILTYKGAAYLHEPAEWARYTRADAVDFRELRYEQIAGIVRAFKAVADTLGLRLKVFDQVDGGVEFVREYFKLNTHTECYPKAYDSFDIRGLLEADTVTYASAPDGTVEGTLCGTFLVDQIGHYVRDLGFDGMLYGNQLGTRGRWQPNAGPGYTEAEAVAIRNFFRYSKEVLGQRELMWFDSYNHTGIEYSTYSVPRDAYDSMDYLIAAGFAAITFPSRYTENLGSKLALRDRTAVLATLDYVDPWYDYMSMTDFPEETASLEVIALQHRFVVDGLVFFANDHHGQLVPRDRIDSFAERYFSPPGIWDRRLPPSRSQIAARLGFPDRPAAPSF